MYEEHDPLGADILKVASVLIAHVQANCRVMGGYLKLLHDHLRSGDARGHRQGDE
jgi:hypothetical protein